MSEQEAQTVEVREDEAVADAPPADTPELVLPEGTSLEEPVEPDWVARDAEGELVTPFPIEMFGNAIVINRDDIADRSEGGLFLPESARHSKFRTMVGTCIAISPGMIKSDGTHAPMPINVGDRVVFEKFRSMIELKVNGFMYHVLNWTDLIGRMRSDATVECKVK